MTAPYDHEALWAKAQLFLNRAMDSSEPEKFDERALWAALALELLGKAALARVSPLLIATPTEDGGNLLIASGLVQGSARFTSIRAHTLFDRCHRAFKPFNSKEATAISNARNDYLHAAAPTFTIIPEVAWWPRFWAQAAILVNALDRSLEDLVGRQRSSVVAQHLAQNTQNIEHRVEMLLERARQRLAMHLAGNLSARLAEEWNRAGDLRAGLRYSATVVCPACSENGFLEGEEAFNHEFHTERVSDDDFDTWVDVEVGADHFSCGNCHLVLEEYELLGPAGVATEFSAIGDPADFVRWDDYGND